MKFNHFFIFLVILTSAHLNAQDIYDALVPEVEVTVEETIDLYPHIQPIVVTAKRRPVLNENN